VGKDTAQPASVRIRAAQVWLEQAWRARELVEFGERLRVLEERIRDGQH
jgi:hypothetical protein